MKPNWMWTAALAALAMAPGAALAQVQPATAAAAASPLDEALEAAGRGNVAPAEALLAAHPRGDMAVLLRAQLAASRLDPAAASDPAIARLAAGGDAALGRAALGLIAEAAFAHGDYARAAEAGRSYAAALAAIGKTERAQGAERTWRLAALLAGRPTQHVEGSVAAGGVAATRDPVGLTRITVTVNGQAQEAVVDTGANLSVLSAETARRLGVTVLEGDLRIGNGVASTVASRVGIADRMEIAGTVLRNVPFLIIDDAQLTFPVAGGYHIPAIVGLPALRPLGRMTITRAGRFEVAASAGPGGAPNLHASGNDIYVDIAVDGRPVAMHIDTGATQTSLSPLYATANADEVARLRRGNSQVASAGGQRQLAIAMWENAPLSVAGRDLTLPRLPVSLPAEGPAPTVYGTIGSDTLERFESYTLDFGAMRLELGEAVASD
jgi:predicted aspartyl protease